MTKTTQICSYCGAQSARHAPFCPACGIPTQEMSFSFFHRDALSSESADDDRLDVEWRVGQVVLGEFVVERLLGEGGMGKVYLLRNCHTHHRFAVKRAKDLGRDERRLFLAELQIWIDLPAHENLVTCHFFRSVGNDILIFADYVEGGSLQDWIVGRKLYTSAASLGENRLLAQLRGWIARRKYGESALQQTLARMLDIAIQFAWGLACLHSLGLVHQDVKPGNVLLAVKGKADIQARVSDFGLARAVMRKPTEIRTAKNILVSCGGRTPAYCSPEQGMGWPLSPATDVWSWGVSVLEMFAGEVFWQAGEAAAFALESYLEHGSQHPFIPPMPSSLSELLRRCFQDGPTRRPEMVEVVEALKAVYRQAVGKEYRRPLQAIQPIKQQVKTEERRHQAGASWRDPREWLEKAWRATGRDMAEVETFLAHHQKGWTRQGELVTQIAIYQEAKGLYEQQIRAGRRGLEYELAILCAEKALIHDTAGDISGALQELDQAIAIYERLAHQVGLPQLASDLATAYMYKVNLLVFSGNARAALSFCDRAIEIRERLASQQEGDNQVTNNLAEAYANKANILWALGDAHASLALYDRGIALLRRQIQQGGEAELAQRMALLCVGKAMALRVLGNNRQAIAFYDEAIGVWERLVYRQGCREFAVPLAISYTNKGMALWSLGEAQPAVRSYDQALALLEPLVYQESRQELEKEVARAFVGKAIALRALNETRAALALYDRAIEIYKRLVVLRGHRELTEDLARAYMNKAAAAGALGDNQSAIFICDQAIAQFEPLVYEQGRDEVANDLAKVYVNKATALAQRGDFSSALAACDQAIRLRERLIYRNGRHELLGDLSRAKVLHALILIESGQRSQGINELRESIKVLRSEATRTDRADLGNILRECERILSQLE